MRSPIAALALLLLVTAAPAQDGTTQSVELNGFRFAMPAEWAVEEWANGQVAFVDVREVAALAADDEPRVRFVVVPRTQARPEDVTRGVMDELSSRLRARGLQGLDGPPARRVIGGADRSGLNADWTKPGAGTLGALHAEVVAFEHGGDVVAVQLVVPQTPFHVYEGRIDALVASIELTAFDPNAMRAAGRPGFAFEVPRMLASAPPSSSPERLTFLWSGGQFDATYEPNGFVQPYERAARSIDRRFEAADERLRQEGGSLTEARTVVRWSGDGFVPGAVGHARSGTRDLELRSFAVPGRGGCLVLGFTLSLAEADAAMRQWSLALVDAVLASVTVRDPPAPEPWTFDGLRLECAGLVDVERSEIAGGTRHEFVLPMAVAGAPRVFVDLRDDLDAGAPAEALPGHLERIARELDPAAVLGGPEALSGGFLGSDGGGLGALCTMAEESRQLYAFAAPVGGRVAVATLVTRPVDAPDALWVFANLLARIAPDGPGAGPADG